MNHKKGILRVAALALVIVMVFGLASTAFAADGTTGKTNDMVNLRTGPSLSATVMDTLGVNTAVTILSTVAAGTIVDGAAVEGTWYQVSTSKGTGYVRADYVVLDTAATAAPTASAGATVTPTASYSTNVNDFQGEFITFNGQRYMKAYITASNVSLRKEPNTTSTKVATLNKDAGVGIVGVSSDFYKVIFDGKTGYVSKQYVRLTGTLVISATPTPVTTVASAVSGPSEWTPVADAPAANLSASEASYWATVPSLYKEYKSLNANTAGFLALPNTNVRYPVMFSNSDFYLEHNIYNQYDKAGLPYIHKNYDDYGKVRHIVVAGHNLSKSGRMFNKINNYKTLSFYLSNPIIRFDYMGVPGEWQIFSDHISKPESKYIQMKFSSDNEWLNYINWLKSAGDHKGKTPDVQLRSNDVVLTLYTCTYESWLGVKGRYFLHFRRVR